jgi:cytochrome c-type biogenesis protein CcmF
VLLSATLGIVLIGTLYPLMAETFGAKVSVGPPYFNPMSALFILPMLVVMAVGPLLRWRRDQLVLVRSGLIVPALLAVAVLLWALSEAGASLLAALGLALGLALAVASLLPLRGRSLRRTPLAVWGMVVAHFGIAVALLGAASDAAFTQEKLVAVKAGDKVALGPWSIELRRIMPVAGPNWTALEADMFASYQGGKPVEIRPQSRSFWAPPQQTSESALITRWNGQLYAVLGGEAAESGAVAAGRWQVRLWWKPFVPLIWYGGMLVALGGVLALIGRVAADLRRIIARGMIAYRRERMGR